MQLWSGSVFFLTISQSAEVEVATKEYSHEINAPPTQHTHWPSEGASYIQNFCKEMLFSIINQMKS